MRILPRDADQVLLDLGNFRERDGVQPSPAQPSNKDPLCSPIAQRRQVSFMRTLFVSFRIFHQSLYALYLLTMAPVSWTTALSTSSL